jgi:UDP-3-O-[3-hydroxymyristoyl] glucosamine N-acyltransferase
MSSKFNKSVSLKEICSALSINSSLDSNRMMVGISDSARAEANTICDYVKGPLPENLPGLVLLTKEPITGFDCVVVKNPQEELIKIISYINSSVGFKKRYKDSVIPDSVTIGKNVVIEDDVEIGEGTVIEHNVVIHSGTRIGKNCLIRTHAAIGGGGFNYATTDNGLVKVPDLGGVDIGDEVEVGSHTCIAKGLVNDTVIKKGVKIDNLVHIAHDCFVDEGAFVIACAELSGYVSLGKRTRIAPGSVIKQRVTIGDDVVVGMGAVVFKNIADDAVVVGNPAKPIRQFASKKK